MQFYGATSETIAVHGGEERARGSFSLTEPIIQTATFCFDNSQAVIDYMVASQEGGQQRDEYGRYGNPTVRAAERKVAIMEGTADAIAFASGMSAVTTTILAFARTGSHIILFSDCYRRTRQFVTDSLKHFGVEATLVAPGDFEGLERAFRPETRLVISEAPTNPFQNVIDLRKLGSRCRGRGVVTLIDATFATPINLQAARYGIDLVVHSGTKYLAGHNDVLAGFVAGSNELIAQVRALRHVLGPILDPHAAYLVLRGMKTLAVRVQQQNRSALALARALEAHAGVREVWYPGLESHRDHAIAAELMTGFGGVVTFAVGGGLARTSRFVDACRLPRIAPSLGGVESLIEQPPLMSYFELSTEARLSVGIPDDLVRYSVGLESAEEIISDVHHALNVIDRTAEESRPGTCSVEAS